MEIFHGQTAAGGLGGANLSRVVSWERSGQHLLQRLRSDSAPTPTPTSRLSNT